MPDGETISQLNYGLFKKLFSRAPSHLTNQVFLMLYGSFEAYIADLVLDGLTHQDTKDPYQEALHLMVLAKWRGKIDRIGQKLNVGLGKRRFVAKFRDMELEFLGEQFKDPLEFLERAGGLRHLLVHSSGRVDEAFASQYPKANMRAADTISLPTDLPIALHLFLVHLSDLFDEIFAAKFGWDRTTIGPETLAGY